MEVVLLGTGSADGWPNPFCRCGSCETQRASDVDRSPSCALVDDVLLLDAGPELAAASRRLAVPLDRVRHVLVTHAHVDHWAPQLLLQRGWVSEAPLDLVGPADVVAQARDWIAPDADVRLVPVEAGDEVVVGQHRVRVLPAAHEVFAAGDAVLYDVTAPDGARLLWGCDTGPWAQHVVETVRDAAYDVVLLEETFGLRRDLGAGHLHLESFADLVARLRSVGAVHDGTEIRAVHLSHHNPPEPELVRLLAASGARPGRDGEWLTTS
ncbi:cobalamin biosynthesis protein CobU [Aeromicrobium sp. Root495]|uniref:MBL fold metallo-hydrolase n=1 Tax=Aeromicrobium sp. Root495 TaxID=1736550 RepID=UPI0006F22615|nr:MBL fold metallo-hydrolase [Aeromicrobium sp. Root495]KQY59591.1 cobalamin biosynthesis protein CobU [Aeromicrobium sp. Root495]RYJ06266.1 MAG: MBL fold metallo-hydrolase [Actinomycetales bacterium]